MLTYVTTLTSSPFDSFSFYVSLPLERQIEVDKGYNEFHRSELVNLLENYFKVNINTGKWKAIPLR